MPHWTEETFVENADVFRPSLEQRTDAADEEVVELVELVGEHGVDPDGVLDVACGIGRHALEFADRGVDAHGVDLSAQYVERAREGPPSAASTTAPGSRSGTCATCPSRGRSTS